MHIAMILSAPLPPQEGIGFYTWNLAKELHRKGNRVTMITRGGMRPTKREVVDGITIYRPPFAPIYPFHVHLHGLFVNRLVRELEGEIDVIHLHSPLVPPIITNIPKLVTFHSSIWFVIKIKKVTNFYSLLMKLQAPVSYNIEQNLILNASKIAAVSTLVADHLNQYPIQVKNISVVYNGVDVNLFGKKTNNFSGKNGNIRVLTVGRLAPGKGIEDFIKAALIVNKTNPEIEFFIAGEGILRKTISEMITRFRMESSIKLLGQIWNRQDIVNLYQSSHIFVLPSYHEGLPTVVLEAMAAGLPVIATKVGGVPDLIQDGLNGLLILPGEVNKLAEKILYLAEDRILRNKIGKTAKDTIEANYTWDQISDLHINHYRGLVNK